VATQGSRRTPRTSSARAPQIINLDDLIVGQRLNRPATVFLLGREWAVRRDLDGAEAVEFWAKATNNDSTALVMLMGEEAADLDKQLQQLPQKVYIRVLTAIFEAAGLKRGDEPEDETGESTAS
jgi:hypothetical protein